MRIFIGFETGQPQGPRSGKPSGTPSLGSARRPAGRTVVIAAAKGGAGTSTLVANVGAALALSGHKVGMVDADLNAPTLGSILGMKPLLRAPLSGRIDPWMGPLGISVVSSDILPEGEPLPVSFSESERMEDVVPANGRPVAVDYCAALGRMLNESRLEDSGVVLVDLSPGVVSLLNLLKTTAPDAAVLVSTGGRSTIETTRTMAELLADSSVPLLGIVENMTSFICDNCHSVRPLLPAGELAGLARELEAPILGRLPFDPRLAQAGELGTIFVRSYPDAPVAKQMKAIATGIASRLEELSEAQRTAASEQQG